jgi:bifunctional UDP-N-acetylglucosamine pyrophosphorylase / glucosamine-1-phosphate N-acetyltransferase
MDTQIVILAAGKGKRMGTKEVPKVLIPLKGKPVISYLLEEVVKLKDLPPPIIVVGHKSTAIKQALGKGFRYALQRGQRGTAHAVWSAQPYVKAKNIFVLYGDIPLITAASLKKLMHVHDSQQAVISMFTAFVPNFEKEYANFLHFGRIIRNEFKEIVKIQEYADAAEEQRAIREINPGIYLFQSQWLWDNIDKIDDSNAQQEFYLTDIVEIAITEGHTIHSFAVNPKEILGINTIEQLKLAEKLLT